VLGAYDEVQQGLAARIVAMAESEAAHRHAMEVRMVDGTFKERARGQHYGLAIGIVAIIAGAWTGALGHQISGSIIGGGGVVGLVAVFVIGRRSNGSPEAKEE
jgi:uncharacterized membrane protein